MTDFETTTPEEFEWPLCPDCGRRLFAACPYCQTPGNHFAQTELAWESERDIFRVICPTCDEAFEPKFLPRCHGCGHAFELNAPENPPPDVDQDGARVWIAFIAMLVVLGAVGVYFVLLLR